MSFPRPHPLAPESAAEAPLSTFTYKTFSGKEKTVEAHYVNFMPGHVAFCLDGPERGVIVLAEVNTNVHELREVS
jgi:hypothetical protein